MSRKKKECRPISLLAFQDIITSVSGIFIFLTLLMALELVTRVIDGSQAVPTPRRSLQNIKEETETLRKDIAQVRRIVESQLETQKTFLKVSETDLHQQIQQIESVNEELTSELQKIDELQQELEAQTEQIPDLRQKIEDLRSQLADLDRREAQFNELEDISKQSKTRFFTRRGGHREEPWIVDLGSERINVFSLKENESLQFPNSNAFFQWTKTRNSRMEYFILFLRPSAIAEGEPIRNRLQTSGFKTGLELIAEDEKIVIAKESADETP